MFVRYISSFKQMLLSLHLIAQSRLNLVIVQKVKLQKDRKLNGRTNRVGIGIPYYSNYKLKSGINYCKRSNSNRPNVVNVTSRKIKRPKLFYGQSCLALFLLLHICSKSFELSIVTKGQFAKGRSKNRKIKRSNCKRPISKRSKNKNGRSNRKGRRNSTLFNHNFGISAKVRIPIGRIVKSRKIKRTKT